ncbi:MAG: hypothetical protein RR501_11850 [Cloacibacillus sp.]
MKDNITIIPEDGFCRIDDETFVDHEAFNDTDFPFHALQWHGENGHIEPIDGGPNIELAYAEGYGYEGYIQLAVEKAVSVKIAQTPPEPTFEELVTAKRIEVWSISDAILAQVKTNFTQAEIESWNKQEQGAKDIQAGNTATEEAKFVATIARGREIDVSVLVAKILTNVASYGALSAAVIGEQQRLDDLIKAAVTPEDLDLIVWTYVPPTGGL